MTGDSTEARPGLAPGARSPVGTMFAALYGELTPHPWRDPARDRDAYALFYDRSLAMDWLDDVGGVVLITDAGIKERATGAPGLWGMNDAGQDHPLAAPDASLVAWFQVGVEPLPADRPLPVQPFLRCAGDVAARIGALDLRAVQVLLPVQGLDPSSSPPEYAGMPSLRTAGWFGDADPRSRTPVRVTLDSGRAPSITSAAPLIRERIGGLEQDVFECESYSLADHDPLATAPPFDDRSWNGPSRHRATFHGTLAEWSLDTLGWLGGFLADLSAGQGVSTPLLLTATRS
ncbi:hypothetical protein GCM10022225_53790 [Plantactinospora mayteni]|uniref:Uncharacterized protein n=1 Tax=Plantactinospora mayteni TaxID=566021 RepID=A0ABQ4ELC5_9ACTN|nr:hypothetical protein [Plantactinospora mayteni]GIG94997.1 hypothetical protein Pma05_15700 [Plantactinospora mayteni]